MEMLDDGPRNVQRKHFVNFVHKLLDEGNIERAELLEYTMVNEVLFPKGKKVKPRDLKMAQLNGIPSLSILRNFILTF